jgi:SNF2 family DNA or RNA helicase
MTVLTRFGQIMDQSPSYAAPAAPGAAIHGEISEDGTTLVLIAAGDDWALAAAAKALRHLTPLFSKSDPPGALTVPATWPAVVQLAHTFDGNGHGTWVPGPRLRAWTEGEFRRRTQPPENSLPEEWAAGLKHTPRAYQIEGAWNIARSDGFLLLDEPGTGKTGSTILGLRLRRLTGGHGVLPVVVICPASVVDPWCDELAAWAPDWRAVAWRGPGRAALAGSADVYVMSYEAARNDARHASCRKGCCPVIKLNAQSVVIDEIHFIANKDSLRSLATRRIARKALIVAGLSGTPIKRDTGDLWPALEASEHGAWPARERFVARYCETSVNDYGESIDGLNPLAEPEFRAALTGSMRRVAKADVLAHLPPKIHSVRTVELPPEWRKAYAEMESSMLAELPDDGGELSVMEILTQTGILARMASSAFDAEVTWEPDKDTGEPKRHIHTTLKAPSWKADELLAIMEERRGGAPIACFAPYRQLVILAGAQAEKAGYRVGYIVGGQSAKERTANREAFQAGKLNLLCVTSSAGGTGITLTAAGTVVFLQRPWPLEEAIQCEDRCQRPGSEIHDVIEIIDIVAKNTVDSRIRAALRSKAGQLADFVRDPRVVRELMGGIK